jgi:peptidoglycan/LPS O-acetylase OafA/YrhL
MNNYVENGRTKQLTKTHIPEIQGLRGVAVLLVVLFHSSDFLPGGFIGVDLFFVISGFVITKLLIREIESDQPKIVQRFFLGRFYRLFPATSVVVLITLVLSALVLSPIDSIPKATAVSRYASIFMGNFGLLQSGGYFYSSNPFEHLWSLGVEAQFYLVYPCVFLYFYRFANRRKRAGYVLACMIVCMVVASLFFATLGARLISQVFGFNARDFSFYMMPSRSWEFLLGTLVAIIPNDKKTQKSIIGRFALLASIVTVTISAIYFDRQNSFPSYLALFPAAGSAIVVCFYSQSFAVATILRSRFLVLIGNISFSWYLWHWPLIVFSEALFPNIQHLALIVGIASLGPAWLSYVFIETKIRFKMNYEVKRTLLLLFCLIVLPMSVSFVIDAIRERLNQHIDDASALEDNRFSVVNQCQHVLNLEMDKCFLKSPGSQDRAVLFGDSHASSASDGTVAAAKVAGFDIGVVSFDGCPPFPISSSIDGCSTVRSVYEQTLAVIKPATVILVNSLEHYLQYDVKSSVSNAYIVDSLSEYVDFLVSNDMRVVILLQVPNMEIGGQVSILRPRLSTSRSNLKDQENRASLLNQLRTKIGGDPMITIVETDEIFCKNDLCDPRSGGELLYRDQSHLSPLGSMLLVKPLANALNP